MVAIVDCFMDHSPSLPAAPPPPRRTSREAASCEEIKSGLAPALPVALPVALKNASKKRQRKPWSPNSKDEIIYRWVRFEGQKQSWVAAQLNVSQATVSRIVQRYERWKLHAPAHETGEQNHTEKLRIQRRLAYERNEHILCSALRIADKVEEHSAESYKNTFHREAMGGRQTEHVQENKSFDQAGVAARFLRLAFRVNMEQLKLCEQEPLPDLPPLTDEEIERDLVEAATDLAELEGKHRSEEWGATTEGGLSSPDSAVGTELTEAERAQEPANGDPAMYPEDAAELLNLHKMHNCIAAETAANSDVNCTCATTLVIDKNGEPACIDEARHRDHADRPILGKRNITRQNGKASGLQ